MGSDLTGVWRSTLAPVSSRDDPRRRAFFRAAEEKVLLQFFTVTPMPRCCYTAQEIHSSAQNALGLPQSHLKSVLGRPITYNNSCPAARVGTFGHHLSIATGVKYDGTRQLQGLPVNLLSKWLRRAKIPHMADVHEGCHKPAKKADAGPGTPADETEPAEAGVVTYNSGRVSGSIVGAFGGVLTQAHDLAGPVVCELSAKHSALIAVA